MVSITVCLSAFTLEDYFFPKLVQLKQNRLVFESHNCSAALSVRTTRQSKRLDRRISTVVFKLKHYTTWGQNGLEDFLSHLSPARTWLYTDTFLSVSTSTMVTPLPLDLIQAAA
jgi:hypothetical protein